MLNYWIEIAIESKTALGNMYAFAAILLGLTMPQVIHLNHPDCLQLFYPGFIEPGYQDLFQ